MSEKTNRRGEREQKESEAERKMLLIRAEAKQ